MWRNSRTGSLACRSHRPTARGEKVQVKATKPPAEVLECAGEPIAPALPPKDGTETTQKVRDPLTLTYVLALRAAWGSCAAAVAGTKAWADKLPD